MMESPWQARTMLDSPHRLCFFWAGAQWLAAALWWLWLLAGDGAAAAVPVVPVHALWFGLGAMPLFIVGFLLTAGPRWLRAPAVAAADLRLGVATFSAGWLLTALGAGIDASLAAAGQLAAAAGLGLLVRRAWQLLRAGTRGDAGHARVIVASLLATALGLAASGLAMLSGHAAASGALGALAQAMLWWGPVAAFIAASHRMLPFLGDGLWPTLDRRLPLWPLWTLLSAAVAQGAIALARGFVTLPATLAALGAAHLGLVALASLALTLRWFGAPAPPLPLLQSPDRLPADFPPIRRRTARRPSRSTWATSCNQSCLHCHVNAGPTRTEMMDGDTVDLVLRRAARRRIARSTSPAARPS
jgi:uncharacterized protein involved in response to NO